MEKPDPGTGKKILGIGNALVDTLIRIPDDAVLSRLNLEKGSMTLVDESRLKSVLEATRHLARRKSAGGSAANTISGLARLGVHSGFIGKVGIDSTGGYFEREMTAHHIRTCLIRGTRATGQCVSLISRDSERTMTTYLGAAVELEARDLDPGMFSGFDCLHIEGYLVQDHLLIENAMKIAKESGLEISLDMASFNIVRENLAFLQRVVGQYVDIVFANEEEARVFTGKSLPHEALRVMSPSCKTAIVKIGSRGSLIQDRDRHYRIDCPPARAIDTTGAGDLYAAGYLYGWLNSLGPEACGRIGTLLAGKVVEVVGAKLTRRRWENINASLQKILMEENAGNANSQRGTGTKG